MTNQTFYILKLVVSFFVALQSSLLSVYVLKIEKKNLNYFILYYKINIMYIISKLIVVYYMLL
jgi:hypothetical protein